MNKTTPKKADIAVPDRYLVMVLGMHRSGTSALSGMLHHLGCALPATPMLPSKNNAKGYFESREVQKFNDRLLESVGSYWRDWRPASPDLLDSPVGRAFLPEARDLLKTEFGDAPLAVLKDPRICRLVPFWTEAAKAAGYRTLQVLTHRNPLEVAKSLQRRNEMATGEVMLIWLRYLLEAEAATRGSQRFVTNYPALMRNWVDVVKQLQERLDLNLPLFDSRSSAKIEDFLTGDLRHFNEVPEKVTGNPTLSRWIRETYEVFERWAATQEAVEDYATLDRIRAEFDMATPAFEHLADMGGESRSALQLRLETQLQALEKERDAARERTGEIEVQLQASEKERDAARERTGEIEAQLQASEKERDAARERTGEIEAQLSVLQREIGDMARVFAETEIGNRSRLIEEQQRSAALAQELLDRQKDQKRLAALERELPDLQKDQKRLVALEQELRRQRTERERLAAVVSQEQKARKSDAAQATLLAQERDNLQAGFAEQQQHIAELTREIEALRGSTSWRLTKPVRGLVAVLRGSR